MNNGIISKDLSIEENGLIMPGNNEIEDIYSLLDKTDPKHIYLSSDWHFFKNHYKHEANYVNTQKIVTWCRQNIKPDDVFMYLGDICFRYANEEDQRKATEIMNSLPGIKILILGNHDLMLGDEYYASCGFKYVFDQLQWQNIIFTHKPKAMELLPEDWWNIHGHIHKWTEYNTTDGARNINVYPYFYDNKPVTLYYLLNHKDELTKNNKRSDWIGMGESTINNSINNLIAEDVIYESEDRSKIDKNYKPLEKYNLNSYKRISLKDPSLMKYIKNDKNWDEKRVKYMLNYDTNGYFYIDEDNNDALVAYIMVCDGFICPMYIYPKYRKHGLSDQILKYAIKNMGANKLHVYKDNEVAIELYKKHGFKEVNSGKSTITMSLNESNIYTNSINETKRSELPDSAFGIPEDRKYPLDTKKHVMSAIKLFGHAEESKKKALAKRIRTAANKYDIRIPETTQVYKTLNEAYNAYLESDIDTLEIPEGVENIIFDIGGVLVYSDLTRALSNSSIPRELHDEACDLIYNKLFYSDNKNVKWFTIQEAKKYLITVASDKMKNYIDELFAVQLSAIYEYVYVDDLLAAVREKGYGLYYLSNWDRYSYEAEKPFFDKLTKKFDGGIFSCECHMEKPSYSIYRLFTSKFNLNPDTCLFFDDKEENIEAAKVCGWNAIKFNSDTTPIEIIKALYSFNGMTLINNKDLPVITSDGLKYADMKSIKAWYIDDSRYVKDIDKSDLHSTIEYAINNLVSDSDLEDRDSCKKYVYTVDKSMNPILLGYIIINKDNTWYWEIQYPITADDNGFISDLDFKLNEWAMNAVNPIVGIHKPFILKVQNDNGSLLDANKYALCTDLISDKYLVINEDAQLQIVDSSFLDDKLIEEYEFVGDIRNFKKIEEAYYTGKIVDNTFFYTALTGKPMLSPDQIDFDSCFKKIDFDAIKEKELSRLATFAESAMDAIGKTSFSVNAISSNNTSYKAIGADLSLMQDFNGYYIKDKYTGKRTASVENESFISQQMIDSIIY